MTSEDYNVKHCQDEMDEANSKPKSKFGSVHEELKLTGRAKMKRQNEERNRAKPKSKRKSENEAKSEY
jgi:hypothetical protein